MHGGIHMRVSFTFECLQLYLFIINFSKGRVPQKAKKPIIGGPKHRTYIHTYSDMIQTIQNKINHIHKQIR